MVANILNSAYKQTKGLSMLNVKIEKDVKKEHISSTGRRSDFPPAKIAKIISEMSVGDSFVIGKEWRARINMACWKHRPLAVSISKINDDEVRVFREVDGSSRDGVRKPKEYFVSKKSPPR